MSFPHRRSLLISVFSVPSHLRVSSLTRVSPFLVFAPYLVHFCSLPCICSIPHFFSLALFFISLLHVYFVARILILVRASSVAITSFPSARVLARLLQPMCLKPRVVLISVFPLFMEGLFKTPLFAQCELRVDINSGIVSVLFE